MPLGPLNQEKDELDILRLPTVIVTDVMTIIVTFPTKTLSGFGWSRTRREQYPPGAGPTGSRTHREQDPKGAGPAGSRAHREQDPQGAGPTGSRTRREQDPQG